MRMRMAWLMRGDQNSPDVNIVLDLPTQTNPIGSSLRDQTLCSVVPADQIMAKHGSLSAPIDGFLYAGLPKNNSDFGGGRTPGYHIEKLTVNGKDSELAHIQTFFAATASNYPTAATDTTNNGYPTPNWFYYYNQVFTATGLYQPGSGSYTDFNASPYSIHIEDQTYGTIGGIHVYALKPGANTISWAGDIQLLGVWLYIMVCAHEKEHQDACTDGTYAVDTTDPNKPLKLTSDGDRLDNTWEDNHYFRSDRPNTTGAPAYGNETDAADDEAIADIVGLGTLLGLLDDWKQDWAGVPSGGGYQGGLQFGTTHLAIKPGDTHPTPYFVFTPVTQNPDGSYTLGTPINIWSKDDLKAAVPNLMTSLLAKPARP